MASILVVDDSCSQRRALEALLSREGYTVLIAASGDEALAHLEQHEVDVLLCDVSMPTMDGLAVLRHVQAHDPGIAAVMMSGHGDITTAVAAMKEGAYDCLVKPISGEDLLSTVQKTLAMRALYIENLVRKRQVYDQFARAKVIGSSPAWQRVCQMVKQIAPSQATVLLTGESGTGKELIAGLLHRLSSRAERPFIVLNAAAMPATLLEAELFGYEKGAFTGALQRKPGHFELADGGTLFLDEIGDMPVEVQAKLLRVLQDGTFKRLGGIHTLRANVRVIAATNKELSKEVAAERFRQDLYYRLNVITIHLPPLRERIQDVPLLAAHFLQKYARENHKAIVAIQQEAIEHLMKYNWPGNVRELENVIERAVVLAKGSVITLADLYLEEQPEKAPFNTNEYFVLPARSTLAQIKREAIIQALRYTDGNREATARLLNIGVATLYRRFKKYQIQ
jgi:two-component system, NtrC family, response regulator HydG